MKILKNARRYLFTKHTVITKSTVMLKELLGHLRVCVSKNKWHEWPHILCSPMW